MIKYARVVFASENSREYTLPIESIFENKKDLNSIIKPKDAKDFRERMVYYVWWSACSIKDCSPLKKCCKFYTGLIKSLGG